MSWVIESVAEVFFYVAFFAIIFWLARGVRS